jgi:hypothetical protein
MRVQKRWQIIGMNDIAQVTFCDVFPFDPVAQTVNDHNVGFTAFFKGGHDIGPDKSGTTGYDQHCILLAAHWSCALALAATLSGLWGNQL